MISTIKVTNETKDRLVALDLAQKNKTYDVLVNELITCYENTNKKYNKDYKDWKKSNKDYRKYLKDYKQEKDQWDKLLKWAKSKGFKG